MKLSKVGILLERLSMKITSRDGKGTDTRAGFILSESGGRKKYYDGDGLLEAVEDLNGRRVGVARDEGKRITRIKGPHGNEWKIRYGGGNERLIQAIEDPPSTSIITPITSFDQENIPNEISQLLNKENVVVLEESNGKVRDIYSISKDEKEGWVSCGH